MRIKKVSSDEVNVYLTHQDLEGFNFKPGEDISHSNNLQNFIFDIMKIVRSETGFVPSKNGQVVIEASASPYGLKLSITKLGITIVPKKLTPEEFKKVKSVHVRKQPTIKALTKDDFIRLLQSIGIDTRELHRPEKKPTYETFVFNSFKALEGVLCVLNEDAVKECVLYRKDKKYAIVTKLMYGGIAYNHLSEFSDISKSGMVLAADISEGWNEISRGEALAEMASEIKKMQ